MGGTREWQSMTCGRIYDEALGLPDDWLCPERATPKSAFEIAEVG